MGIPEDFSKLLEFFVDVLMVRCKFIGTLCFNFVF